MESEAEVDSKHVESKEDMFVDAADDIEDNQSQEEMDNGDTQADDTEENQLQQQINHTDTQADDKRDNQFQEEMVSGDTQAESNLGVEDNISSGCKEEKEDLIEEVYDLLKQLRDLTNEQSLPGDYNGDSKEKPISASLSEMIKECSQRVKISAEERLQTENMISELRDLTDKQSFPRDDNEDPKNKLGVASLSEMINDCSEWVKAFSEQRLQTENTIRDLQSKINDLNGKVELEQNVEVFADRILGSLSTVVNQEELFDYSVLGKIAHVERSVSLLTEQYRWFLLEADQLRQCLIEGGFNVGEPEDFGYDRVFSVARGELLELKKTESEMSAKLGHLEDVNQNLVEEIEKEKAMAIAAASELEKVKVELEQEKTRLANTKEKLSMAVTKGKALVQERVSLKQSLAEKTSELEKYLVELQEKSSAADAAEKFKEELEKCENLVVTLQDKLTEKNAVLESCELAMSKITFPEEFLSMDISQRLQWLVDVFASLKESQLQNDAIFENFDAMFSQLSVSKEMESTDRIKRLSWLVSSVASLQEMLSQKKQIAHCLEEILSNITLPEELVLTDTVEKFRWIVEERDALKSNLLEFHILKDALSLIDLPETVSSCDLGTRISWLKESVDQAKHEIDTLQDEISKTKDAAQNKIEQLKASLLAELQEKEYIKMQLDELAHKYEMVFNQANQASLEKEQVVQLLLKRSGIQDTYTGSDVATLVEKCFVRIKEQSTVSLDTFHANPGEFERMQSLLYLRVQDLMLCEKVLEEDELVRSQLTNLSNELAALKAEKDSLQKDLERSEERSLLLKEKLSLAVKKGKGLVQDRENMKNTLDEKNSEIEKLKLELQHQESAISEWRDQINRFSVDVEQVPKLEADLADVKNQRDQFEQFLLESNDILKKVIEAVDHIVVPVDSSFQEPVEKLNWIAAYVNECQQAKDRAEKELERVGEETGLLSSNLAEAEASISSMEVAFSDARNQISQLENALSVARNQVSVLTEEKRAIEIAKENLELDLQMLNEEAQTQNSKLVEASETRTALEDALALVREETSLLSSKLAEAEASISSMENAFSDARNQISQLEDALSVAQNQVSLLNEEKRALEMAKENLELDLQKLNEEARTQTSNFMEASESRKALEDALAFAEENNSLMAREREEAQQSRVATEMELEKAREEVTMQTGKLTEAYMTIKSLEDALSRAEANVSLLSEQNNHFEHSRESLESELSKLKEEAQLQASRFEDVSIAMKSLEESLSKAKNDVSVLEGEKRDAELEISALNSKLKACMDELDGTAGSLGNRSSELVGHISDLQMLLKNESPLSIFRQHFEKEFESLRNIDHVLNEIKDCFVDSDSKVVEERLHLTGSFPSDLGNVLNVEMEENYVNATNSDSISLGFRKIIEGFHLRDRALSDNFSVFSSFIDKFVEAVLAKLMATKDEITVVFEQMECAKQKIKSMEMQKEEQEKTIATLERSCGVLLSACTNTISKLQFEVKNDLLELRSIPELEKLNGSMITEAAYINSDESIPHKRLENSKNDDVAKSLISTTGKVHNLVKQFESTSNVAASIIEDLQKKLGESKEAYETSMEERSVVQMRVIELEKNLEEIQNSCEELQLKTRDYQALEVRLKEKDAELSSLHHNLSMRKREAEEALMSGPEINSLFNKISEIEFSYGESFGVMDSHSSNHVQKLFSIIDNIPKLHLQINALSNDKEKLELTLSSQALEIENLREEIEEHVRNQKESEKIQDETFELTLGIERLIEILGDVEVVENQKSAGFQRILTLVEKKISALLMETKNSKSQAEELGKRLLESQKVIEDLSAKVNLLENSSRNKTLEPEIVQERSIFEAPSLPTGSEISEIEDVGLVGKNATLPVSSAAQLRGMKKGSADHLVLNVDSEFTSLINNEETAEDKGHVFKSLNTSGLIPKQGKLVADRIDGIWVSGGRVLMSRPKARLGFITYWILLHMWLLATIL